MRRFILIFGLMLGPLSQAWSMELGDYQIYAAQTPESLSANHKLLTGPYAGRTIQEALGGSALSTQDAINELANHIGTAVKEGDGSPASLLDQIGTVSSALKSLQISSIFTDQTIQEALIN